MPCFQPDAYNPYNGISEQIRSAHPENLFSDNLPYTTHPDLSPNPKPFVEVGVSFPTPDRHAKMWGSDRLPNLHVE